MARRHEALGSAMGTGWSVARRWPGGTLPQRLDRTAGRSRAGRGWRWWWRFDRQAAVESPDEGNELSRVEAVLFLAREPLPGRRIAQHARVRDARRVRQLVNELNARYEAAETAFHVVEVAGGFQLRTRAVFARWLRRLPHVPPPLRLSSPAMETLAVVAYRQPVIRAEIESIRGVHCGEMLRQLMERDLIRICGRSDELGRPFLYATTRKFLEVFGLRSLDLLPEVTIFQNSRADSESSLPSADASVGSQTMTQDKTALKELTENDQGEGEHGDRSD